MKFQQSSSWFERKQTTIVVNIMKLVLTSNSIIFANNTNESEELANSWAHVLISFLFEGELLLFVYGVG